VDRPSSWHEKLAFRWAQRQARSRIPGGYTGSLTHQTVVPADAAGRPGFRLRTAGPSSANRSYNGLGSTSDFWTKTGPHSHLMGTCYVVYDDDIAELGARAEAAAGDTILDRVELGLRCVTGPAPSVLAGEPAVTYTLEITTGPTAGMLVTDWMFEHDGWGFTVGLFLSPLDGHEARELALSTLDSWTWLPYGR
jgi:hypothetical protein